MPTIDSTIDFIKIAHTDVLDRTGFPYWEHPYRVMQHLGAKATNEERKAALLHDVVENAEKLLLKYRGALRVLLLSLLNYY